MRRRNQKLFDKVLEVIYGYEGEGDLTLTFTADNATEGCKSFLNFRTYPKITCTFGSGPVTFDCDEPLPLEECPASFLESVIKVAKGMTEDEFEVWYELNCC